jgi:hypothetical protein
MEDGNLYTAHDTVERKWQHLNFSQHTCYLHARIPKVKQSDGKIKTQQFLGRANSHFDIQSKF